MSPRDGSWCHPECAVGLHHQRQYPLTQAAVGDAHALSWKCRADLFQYGAAGEHQVGAVAPDARIVHALGIAHGEKVRADLGDVVALEPAAIDAGTVIAPEAQL